MIPARALRAWAFALLAMLFVAGCATTQEPPAPKTTAQTVQRLAYELSAVIDVAVEARKRGDIDDATALVLNEYIDQGVSALKIAAAALQVGDAAQAESQLAIARGAILALRKATAVKRGTGS